MNNYILNGHEPVLCDDILAWAKWFENCNRHVALDLIEGARISTVFLGTDHRWGEGPPLLFETMVFGGTMDEEQERYSTWDQAEAGHKNMVEKVRQAMTRETKNP